MAANTALRPGSHDAIIDGINQHYRVAGTGPVCIVHPGGPGLNPGYLDLAALEPFFTMVYLDPIGTGGTGRLADHPRGYTLDRYAHALGAFIRHLDEPKPMLLGHSHGGFVALAFTLANPTRVKALILYDSAAAAGAEFFAEAGRNIDRFLERHRHRSDIQLLADAWNAVPAVSDDASFTATLRALFPAYFADYWAHEEHWTSLRDGVRGTYVVGGQAPFDVRDRLAEILQPTLVIVGVQDFICSPLSAEVLVAGLQHAELLRLEQSGHFGHLEEPEHFATGVANFAARHNLFDMA